MLTQKLLLLLVFLPLIIDSAKLSQAEVNELLKNITDEEKDELVSLLRNNIGFKSTSAQPGEGMLHPFPERGNRPRVTEYLSKIRPEINGRIQERCGNIDFLNSRYVPKFRIEEKETGNGTTLECNTARLYIIKKIADLVLLLNPNDGSRYISDSISAFVKISNREGQFVKNWNEETKGSLDLVQHLEIFKPKKNEEPDNRTTAENGPPIENGPTTENNPDMTDKMPHVENSPAIDNVPTATKVTTKDLLKNITAKEKTEILELLKGKVSFSSTIAKPGEGVLHPIPESGKETRVTEFLARIGSEIKDRIQKRCGDINVFNPAIKRTFRIKESEDDLGCNTARLYIAKKIVDLVVLMSPNNSARNISHSISAFVDKANKKGQFVKLWNEEVMDLEKHFEVFNV